MRWTKLGLVYGPDGSLPWAAHSALTPTPVVLPDGRLRVYAGFRDAEGVSRVGWVDLDPADPTRVVRVCREPALDVGKPGCFDDNGVILGDVVPVGDRLRMYYVGFQLVRRVKFLAFTGVAESTDGGDSFSRLGDAPVLDRADEGLYFRAVHTALPVGDRWRVWYGVGSGWADIGGQPYPAYHVRTIESDDGMAFGREGRVCVAGTGREYRVGRPRVWADDAGYHMLFTYGTLDGDYLPGYARSADGVTWVRDDARVGLGLSAGGWDSRSVSYLAPVRVGGRWYVVYNGNDMGRDGFGCAVLDTGGAGHG